MAFYLKHGDRCVWGGGSTSNFIISEHNLREPLIYHPYVLIDVLVPGSSSDTDEITSVLRWFRLSHGP